MHYHNRYKAHTDSLKQESKLKGDIQGKISISENKESKIKDYSWVINGLNRLFRSRRVLSYSYPFAFYMFGDEIFKDEMTLKDREMKQNLFEDQQQQLEFNVERLSGFLEKDFQNFTDDEVMDTMKHVINLSNVVDRLCKQMYQCIENDLLYPLRTPHNIAPYKSKGLDRASEFHISWDSAEQSSQSMKHSQEDGCRSQPGPSVIGKRPILQLHGSSSDDRGHCSHKRGKENANGGGAPFDLNVPPEVADKI
jgi:ariadne-1